MQNTHSSNKVPHSNATETRKNIGTIPSAERYNVGDHRVPVTDLHLRFVNDGSNRIRKRLAEGIRNVTVVYLDSIYCNAVLPAVFVAGIRFTKGNNHFTPNSLNADSGSPHYTIWIHPTFENNALGAGTYIIQDTTPRIIRSYRQAEYLSDFEVSLVDASGASLPWTEMFINLKIETIDWQ